MQLILNEEESKAYFAAQSEATTLGLSFGAFITKAMDYKVKIKSRDAVISDLKATLKDLKSGAKAVEKPMVTIPDLYAAQKEVQKEVEAAHIPVNQPKATIKPKASVPKVTVTAPAEPAVNPPKSDNLKCRLNKADKIAFHALAEGKVKSNCEVRVFAAKRDLRLKTVLTYIKKHSGGQYTTVEGCQLKGSQIWAGASIYDHAVYFTMSK